MAPSKIPARIEESMPIVERLVSLTVRRFSAVPRDELRSEALELLTRADRSYDPELQVPWPAYLVPRLTWGLVKFARQHLDPVGSADRVMRVFLHVIAERGAPEPEPLTLDELVDLTPEKAESAAETFVHQEAAALFAGLALPARHPDGEAHFVRKEALLALGAAIDHLTPEERWLVERHYRDEMPIETIAREIKTSYRSCKRLHAHVKEVLAKRLRGFGPEDL